MATTTDKNRCAICNKEKATLRCGGCSKDFCFNHVADHRQQLCKQLDEVEVARDLFRQTLTEKTSQPQKHPLMQQIDEWERESINKIQQTATEARQLLIQHTTGHIAEIEIQLNKLTDQLRKSREEDDFFETDLSRWKKEIARLMETLNKPPNFSVQENSTSLVTKIIVDVQNEEKTIPKGEEQALDTFFTNEKRVDSAHRKNNNQSPKISKPPSIFDKINRSYFGSSIIDDDKSNNQPKPKSSAYSISDDDNSESNPKQRQYDFVTRSLASLLKLRVTFDDSDDDDPRCPSPTQEDVTEYRNNYPNARSNPKIIDNLDFYTNKIRSHPDGGLIDYIYKKWFGDYREIESDDHGEIESDDGYIERLFPLQERGLTWSAEPLQKHEIESITQDKALQRVLKSYQLMLDFYGFELVNDKTGEIRRLPSGAYKDRFRNLNTSSHNYLRITRILKCLGEFNYEHLKFPFLEAILRESITQNTLSNCLRSCKDYWIETLRNQNERRAIRQYARELIEYRNRGMDPPKSHRAIRPPSIS